MRQEVAYKRLKIMEKLEGRQTKKWSRTRDGRLGEILIGRLLLGKFQCFGSVVTYRRWSHVEVRLYLTLEAFRF